jgi:site-specific recombinase XerC
MTFGEYVNDWYERQDLAVSTMQSYRRTIEDHLLPAFQDFAIAAITAADVARWEKRERGHGYADASVRLWRTTLHLILADAVDEGLRESNPAARRRGRGKRAGRSEKRAPEKTVTTGLGVLLLAERAALLSGRDDEFVAVVTLGFIGLRWGELVGLETRYVRPDGVRVEWQLLRAGHRRAVPLPAEGRLLPDGLRAGLAGLAPHRAGRPLPGRPVRLSRLPVRVRRLRHGERRRPAAGVEAGRCRPRRRSLDGHRV